MSEQVLARQQEVNDRLHKALAIQSLEIIDESHLHKGHPGAKGGASHFALVVVSPEFKGLSLLKRHRLVYAPLNEMIPNAIHALKIKALSPEEVAPASVCPADNAGQRQ